MVPTSSSTAAAPPLSVLPAKVAVTLAWPHPDGQKATRWITYTNRGGTLATLRLSVSAKRAGQPVKAHPFRLSRSTVKVPAGRSAKVKLTIVGSGVPTGQYTGVLLARTGRPQGPVRTGLTAIIKPKPADPIPPPVGPGGPRLRVAALDRTGKPARISVSLDELIDWNTGGLPTSIVTGQSAFIPAGQYGLTGSIHSPDGSTTVASATVQLSADTDVVLDARRGKPINVRVATSDAQPVGTVITIGEDHRYGADIRKPLYVLPMRGMKYRFDSIWARHGTLTASPYIYQLADHDDDGVPENPRIQIDDSKLAKVTTTFRAHDNPTNSLEIQTLSAATLNSTFSGSTFVRRTAPFRITRYFTPGIPYLTFVTGENNLITATKTYAAGAHTEVWGGAVLSPLPYDPRWEGRTNTSALAYRQGNLIEFEPSSFCGYGQSGHYTGCTGIYNNDSTLTTTSGRAIPGTNGEFRVPSEPETYVLAHTIKRQARLATKLEMKWTFTSGRPESTTRLPLNTVRHNVQGLDGHNRAYIGTRTHLALLLEGPDSTTPQIQTATVEISFDDGKTWTPATTSQANAQWGASITNPNTPGFVAVRTTATDRDGNTITQTTHRAYELVR